MCAQATARYRRAMCGVLSLGLFGGIPASEATGSPRASEIVIGQTMPYTGPASAYSVIGKAEIAYFAKINAAGGINGHRVMLISLDDGYSPPNTFAQTRKLVEQDHVIAIFSTFGTPTNAVIQRYLNQHEVPQLFPTGGATQWNQPKAFPWTFGWQPNYADEMKIYAAYALKHVKNPRIGILYQNDDVGRDNLAGLKSGLGPKWRSLIVKAVGYDTTDTNIDAQVLALKQAGVNVFFNTAFSKFAAEAIQEAAGLGWHPLQFLSNYSSSVGAELKPAGLANSQGIISTQFQKDPTDAQWHQDEGYLQWLTWMKQYNPSANPDDIFNVYGYLEAQTLAQVLRQCGDDFSRQNLRKQAESLHNLKLGMLLPGVVISTSAKNHEAIRSLRLIQFEGKSWKLLGPTA